MRYDYTEDAELGSEPSHKVAMTVRAVVCGISDLNDLDTDELETGDVADLLMAHSQLRRILDLVLRKKAA